jgi:type VI secretion system protein VasG
VDVRTVANVIADWTGVPLSSLMKDEQTELLTLENEIGKRVVGQDVALRPSPSVCVRQKRASRPRTVRRAYSCWWDRAAWGKPKPRLRWPMLYGGEKSSLPSTCPNTRSRTPFPS